MTQEEVAAVAGKLSEMRRRLLFAVCDAPHPIGSWDAAYYAKYRPSKNYRVAAGNQLRAMADLGLITRLIPRDEGGTYKYCAREFGRFVRDYLREDHQP